MIAGFSITSLLLILLAGIGAGFVASGERIATGLIPGLARVRHSACIGKRF